MSFLDSARDHGLDAAGRYGQLILTVMAALGDEPHMIGSTEVPCPAGIRAYPSRLGRRRVKPGHRATNPRHIIVHRQAADGMVEIPGLIHDRMVLSRATLRIVWKTDRA